MITYTGPCIPHGSVMVYLLPNVDNANIVAIVFLAIGKSDKLIYILVVLKIWNTIYNRDFSKERRDQNILKEIKFSIVSHKFITSLELISNWGIGISQDVLDLTYLGMNHEN